MTGPRRRLAALRVLSGALKGERSMPSVPSGAGLRASDGAWRDTLELARELSLGPALWGAIHDVRDDIPRDVAEELHRSHLLNAVRNARLRSALIEAVQALNDAGVVPMLFKGALALVDGTHGAMGGRWMVDLDVLVATNDMPVARRTLERLGYVAEPGRPFLHPHELPFVRERSSAVIELHNELGSEPIPSILPARAAWAASVGVAVGDGQARAPAPTHQVLHNVLHAAVQDLNHSVGGLPLRQLIALERLVRRHGDAIDWTSIRERMEDHGLGRAQRDHLWLAHRYAGMMLPEERRGLGSRIHEARVVANFALVWPADVQRNLRFAFGRAYLDSLYGHRDRRLRLLAARVRHGASILRRDGRRVLDDVLARRG